jgi:hypothetical protein
VVCVILCSSIKGFAMPNCRLFHTIEKNILITVKNWWSLPYGQLYIHLLLMIQSITSLTASYPVQFLNTSPHSLNQGSQSVLRVLLPFLYQNSVPHFDCHPLTSRPILMNANVRPHRACIMENYLQQEAIELLQDIQVKLTA